MLQVGIWTRNTHIFLKNSTCTLDRKHTLLFYMFAPCLKAVVDGGNIYLALNKYLAAAQIDTMTYLD